MSAQPPLQPFVRAAALVKVGSDRTFAARAKASLCLSECHTLAMQTKRRPRNSELRISTVDLAHQVRANIMSLAFSATIAVGALVFEPIRLGKILLSQIRSPEKPFTFMV